MGMGVKNVIKLKGFNFLLLFFNLIMENFDKLYFCLFFIKIVYLLDC